MAFQPAPNCAEAVLQMTFGGIPAVNVLNFFKPGGYDQTDITDLAEAIDTWYGETLQTRQSAAVTYLGTLVRGLGSLNDFEAFSALSAGTGTQAGPTVPNNASVVITHRTGLTGRSARGRTYVGGFPSARLTSTTTVHEDFMANLVADFTLLRTVVAPSVDWTFIVLSRFSEGVQREEGEVFIVQSSEARNNRVDSQRRRLGSDH